MWHQVWTDSKVRVGGQPRAIIVYEQFVGPSIVQAKRGTVPGYLFCVWLLNLCSGFLLYQITSYLHVHENVVLLLFYTFMSKDLEPSDFISLTHLDSDIKESQNIASLHNQITACDAILEVSQGILILTLSPIPI